MKKLLKLFLFFGGGVLLFCSRNVAVAHAEEKVVISAEDYGVTPGEKDNAQAIWNALTAAKNQGDKEVVLSFPKGEYHIYKENSQKREYHTSNTNSIENPIKTIGILVEDQKNLTIEGNGSIFVMHGDMMALAVVNSSNIKLQNFEWDFAVPTVSEMVVKETGKENGKPYSIYSVPADCPFEIRNNQVVWNGGKNLSGEYYWEKTNDHGGWTSVYYDPETEIIRRTYPNYGNNPFNGTVQAIGDHEIKVIRDSVTHPFEKPGVVWTFCATPMRTTAGAFNWESKDIVVQNVDVHYMHGFGWLTQMCENVSYDSCDFLPREGTGRIITSYADLIHVSGAKGKISVTNCNMAFSLDDHINVHGTFTRVDKRHSDGKTLTLRYVENQQGGFPQYHEGDEVVFAKRAGLGPLGGKEEVYTVESVVDPFEDGNDGKTMQVTFNKELPQELENANTYVAENITYTAEVYVANNDFSKIPTRSILCTTRKPVVIENNKFATTAMQPIFLSNDSYAWYESGPIRDMTIRNNTFYVKKSGLGDLQAAIHVHPEIGGMGNATVDQPVHKNITITENTFYMDPELEAYNVFAESVENLQITNNTFCRMNPEINMTLKGDTKINDGETSQLSVEATGKKRSSDSFKFSKCNGVTLRGNKYDDGMKLKIVNDNSKNIINDDKEAGLSEDNNNISPVVGKISYVSSDESIATVNKDGVVAPVKGAKGTAEIKARYEWIGGKTVESNALTVSVNEYIVNDDKDTANLIKFGSEEVEMSQEFDMGVTEYTGTTMNSEITFVAQAQGKSATIEMSLNGVSVSGNKIEEKFPIYNGDNHLKAKVTSENGQVKEYSMVITGVESTYLSDLDWEAETQYPKGEFLEKDHSKFDGELIPLEITGENDKAVVYQKGLGTHAPHVIEYNLGGRYKQLTGVVGMAYNTRIGAGYGEADMSIVAIDKDGAEQVLFSKSLKNNTPGQTINLDIEGVEKIRLVGECGQQPWADRVNWCDMKLHTGLVERPEYQISVDNTIKNGTVKVQSGQTSILENDRVVFEIIPEKGYAIKNVYVNNNDVLQNVADDNTYTIEHVKEDIHISAVFEPAKPIAKISIGKIKMPKAGEKPEEYAKCEAAGILNADKLPIVWKTKDGTVEDAKFQYYTEYYAEITVKAENGFYIPENVNVSVDGQNMEVVSNKDGSITVTKKYDRTEKAKVTKVPAIEDIYAVNGVQLEELQLPTNIVVETEAGEVVAEINWDLKGAEYDPKNPKESVFEIYGELSLPEDIEAYKSIKVKVHVGEKENVTAPPHAGGASNGNVSSDANSLGDNTNSTGRSPKTSDASTPALWGGIAILALIAAVISRKRKCK